MAESDISERVSTLTRTIGISQQRLADQLGVSRRAVRRYEKGEIRPRPEVRDRLNRLYNKATLGVERTPTGRVRYTKTGKIRYDDRVQKGVSTAREIGIGRRQEIIRQAPRSQAARMARREIDRLESRKLEDTRQAYAQARRAYIASEESDRFFELADKAANLTNAQLRAELTRLQIAGRGRQTLNKRQRFLLLDRYYRSRGEAALARSEEEWKDFADRREQESQVAARSRGGDVYFD